MNYYFGGLAELVTHPSTLTYSFMKHWFTGANSLGKAMQLLKLPFRRINEPIITLHEDSLVTDLDAEERTMYENTVFSYAPQKNPAEEPKLKLKWSKMLFPGNYPDTFRLLIAQSLWLAKPGDIVTLTRKLLAGITTNKEFLNIAEIDEFLASEIWPPVIVIGALAEYLHQAVVKNHPDANQIWDYISREVAKRDWFFQSLADQQKVKSGEISFKEYLEKYGLRADIDYELTSPRWREIPGQIHKRILNMPTIKAPSPVQSSVPKYDQPVVSAIIELQVMRSEARRLALVYLSLLRQAIIRQTGTREIAGYTREALLTGKAIISPTIVKRALIRKTGNSDVSSGKGMGVSAGEITAVARHVRNNQQTIPRDTIGIFPNATPEFTTQFPRCAGLIFLRGGQTSHGAIVAREYHIPALIDAMAETVPDGAMVTINGMNGRWKIVTFKNH